MAKALLLALLTMAVSAATAVHTPNVADVCDGTVHKVCDRKLPWELGPGKKRKGNNKKGKGKGKGKKRGGGRNKRVGGLSPDLVKTITGAHGKLCTRVLRRHCGPTCGASKSCWTTCAAAAADQLREKAACEDPALAAEQLADAYAGLMAARGGEARGCVRGLSGLCFARCGISEACWAACAAKFAPQLAELGCTHGHEAAGAVGLALANSLFDVMLANTTLAGESEDCVDEVKDLCDACGMRAKCWNACIGHHADALEDAGCATPAFETATLTPRPRTPRQKPRRGRPEGATAKDVGGVANTPPEEPEDEPAPPPVVPQLCRVHADCEGEAKCEFALGKNDAWLEKKKKNKAKEEGEGEKAAGHGRVLLDLEPSMAHRLKTCQHPPPPAAEGGRGLEEEEEEEEDDWGVSERFDDPDICDKDSDCEKGYKCREVCWAGRRRHPKK